MGTVHVHCLHQHFRKLPVALEHFAFIRFVLDPVDAKLFQTPESVTCPMT
jgi:hypothetical protein